MAGFKDLTKYRKPKGKKTEVLAAVSHLTHFLSMIKGVFDGGTTTLVEVGTKAGVTAAALLKLTAKISPTEGEPFLPEETPARADEVTYVLTQRAYLNALERHLRNADASSPIAVGQYRQACAELERQVINPDLVEVT